MTETEVSDLPRDEDGFGAEWDESSGVMWLIGYDGRRFMISPDEVRRLAKWAEDNKLS